MQCRFLIAAAFALFTLGGCGDTDFVRRVEAGEFTPQDSNLEAVAYRAADDMLAASPTLERSGGPVVVMSIADIRDVDHSTPFGNIVADMLRTRLVQRGVAVTEIRLRSSVRLDRTDGELMLGRNRRTLLPPPVAAEVVTGTYALGQSEIYVSLKIVEASDAHILAAADFVTPRTWNVEELLTGSVFSAR
jgi:hypothetical protein